MLSFAGHFHIPVPAVPGNIPEIAVLIVCGTEEYALPRMWRYPSAETRTVLIVLSGNKSLHLVQVSLFHAGQFADLHDPVTLQFLRRCLVIHI